MSAAQEPILIWGAGAMGGTIGAYLARAGQPVTLVDTAADHVAAIRDNGLEITGPIDEFTVEVAASTPEELTGTWRIALLGVKAQHTSTACEQMAPHLAPGGAVLSLQNGLYGEIIAGQFGRAAAYQTVGSVAGDVLGPGRINFGIGRDAMPIGQIDGDNGPIAGELVEAVRAFAPDSYVTDDIQQHLWQKHCFNTITGGTAVAASPLAELATRDDLRPLWVGLIREVIAVGEANGTPPPAAGIFQPADFAPGKPLSATDPYFDVFRGAARGKPHSGPWRDIAVRGRKTEVGAMLTPICELGDRHGVPTPLLRATVAMVAAVENGERPQDDENLYEILAAGAERSS